MVIPSPPDAPARRSRLTSNGSLMDRRARCRGILTARTPSSTSRARTSPTSAGPPRGRRRCATAASWRRARWCAPLRSARAPPKVFISASAIGYYGPRGDEPITETAAAGIGLSGAVVRRMGTGGARGRISRRRGWRSFAPGLALGRRRRRARENVVAVQARTWRDNRIGRSIHAVDSCRRLDGDGVVARCRTIAPPARSMRPRRRRSPIASSRARSAVCCAGPPCCMHRHSPAGRARRDVGDAPQWPARAARRCGAAWISFHPSRRSNRRCEVSVYDDRNSES